MEVNNVEKPGNSFLKAKFLSDGFNNFFLIY